MARKKTDDVENFYMRDPKKALKGMMGLTLEEKGVYGTLIDMMYDMWRPLAYDTPRDRQYVANWIGAAPQKVNPIIARLIDMGRVSIVQINGRDHLTDDVFEVKYAEFKGPIKWRQSPAEVSTYSDDVGASTGDVEAKSGDVEKKSGLHEEENQPNQEVARLEKSKKRPEEEKEKIHKKKTHGVAGSGPVDRASPPPAPWAGDARYRRAVVRDLRFGEAAARSCLDPATVGPNGEVICRTGHAFKRLSACPGLVGLAVIKPPGWRPEADEAVTIDRSGKRVSA